MFLFPIVLWCLFLVLPCILQYSMQYALCTRFFNVFFFPSFFFVQNILIQVLCSCNKCVCMWFTIRFHPSFTFLFYYCYFKCQKIMNIVNNYISLNFSLKKNCFGWILAPKHMQHFRITKNDSKWQVLSMRMNNIADGNITDFYLDDLKKKNVLF